MTCDIFISYGRGDRELVASIARRLEGLGVSALYDARIEPGAEGPDETADAVSGAGFVALLFADECNRSRQVAREIAQADLLAKPVVPLLIEATELHGALLHTLADRRWINFASEARERADDIAGLLARLAGKPDDKPAPPGVTLDLPDYVGLTGPDGAPVKRMSGGAFALVNVATLGLYGLLAGRRAIRNFRTNIGMT